MPLFDKLITPAQDALKMSGQRHGILQSVFPDMQHPDVTGMYQNPSVAAHLPPRNPTTPKVPAANTSGVVARAVAAVTKHLSSTPKPKLLGMAPPPTAAQAPATTTPGSAGPASQPSPEAILKRNPLAPAVRDAGQLPRTSSSPMFNALFPR